VYEKKVSARSDVPALMNAGGGTLNSNLFKYFAQLADGSSDITV
jgi:hypothetical protein